MCRAESGARTLEDLLKSEEKEYGRKIAKAQKVGRRFYYTAAHAD